MLNNFISHLKSFAMARSIMAAVELNIFPLLEAKFLTRAELIERCGLADTPITHAFLDVLVASELLAEKDKKLTLLPLSQSILPVYESIQSWNREMDLYYRSLDSFTDTLKTGSYRDTDLTKYWAYKGTSNRAGIASSDVDAYSSVMASSQVQLSKIIVDTYDFSKHQHVIDFGGGYAQFAITLAQKYPHLKVTVADLPAVIEGAKGRIESAGLSGQISCLPVDFLQGELPVGSADAIMFIRVLHDWSDRDAATLLARTRACLNSTGVALVVEPMPYEDTVLNPSSSQTNLMLTLLGGQRRSVQTMTKFLESGGYTNIHWRDCGFSLYKMVIAQL